MKEYSVLSPEKIYFSFNLAGLGSRFAALLIDGIIQSVLAAFFVAGFFLMGTSFSEEMTWFEWLVIAILIIGLFIIFYGYFIFFETIWNGQTPGKRAMKLRVIRDDGGAVTFVSVLIRNVLRLVDSLLGGAIGVISILVSKKCQRLGDMAAGTLVVREQVQGAPRMVEIEEKEFPWSGKVKLRIHGVTEDEFAMLKSFLLRWPEMEMEREAAKVTEEKLTAFFAVKLGVEIQEIGDGLEFLQQVAGAYQRR